MGTLERVTEYGSDAFNRHGLANIRVLAESVDPKGRPVLLTESDAGWEIAGSAARWTDGHYKSTTMIDGMSFGRKYVKTGLGLERARADYGRRKGAGA